MIDLPDEVRRDVERWIERWGGKLSESNRNGLDNESRTFRNWLFGAEVLLGLLGLDGLMQAALDAQANGDPFKEDSK